MEFLKRSLISLILLLLFVANTSCISKVYELISLIPNIGLFDWVLAIFYLIIIYIAAIVYRNKKIDKNPEYKYFILGLSAKIFGGIGFALFSVYYYQGGDTFVFFKAATDLNDYFISDFGNAVKLMFTGANDIDLGRYNFSPSSNYIVTAEDVLCIVKITTVTNFFTSSSYLVSSILFALFSFFGLWFAYSNLCKLYPESSKYLLVAFMLIPTALLWSSGILKDTVTQGVIGWLLYSFSNIFILKRKVVISIITIIVGSYIMFLLKPYILYILIPCLLIWVQSNIKNLIASNFVRAILKPLIITVMVVMGYFLFQNISDGAGKYGVENIEQTLIGFQSWHEYLAETRDQSGYTLGEMDFTPLGILQKAPAALNVTLFRPYLWQARNIPTLLGSVEGMILLFYFVYLIVKLRFRFFTLLVKNKEAFFMMLFAIVFGVVVGITSYNYGALSRYKIPAVMFFIVSLVLIEQQSKKKKAT